MAMSVGNVRSVPPPAMALTAPAIAAAAAAIRSRRRPWTPEAITPAVRVTYKLLNHLSIESQVLYERAKTEGTSQNDTTSNVFYYIGYRYDLQ